MNTTRPIIFYTQVCAPCQDSEYHYYDILNAIAAHQLTLDERFTEAVPAWKEQAEAFHAPLPILYSPKLNQYISTYPYNKEAVDTFLDYVDKNS